MNRYLLLMAWAVGLVYLAWVAYHIIRLQHMLTVF